MSGDLALYEEILRLKAQRTPAALCLLVEVQGSAPQKAGAKMLVRSDRTIMGTIGGGRLEAQVIDAAINALAGGGCRTLDVQLTEAYGYACGGRVRVYIEPIVSEPHLVIFGAGHVGRALCGLGRFAGFQVTVGDDRAEFADEKRLPEANKVVLVDWDRPFCQVLVDENTFVVIATRGHLHDFQVVAEALKTPAPYIGLVGSRKKQATLAAFLKDRGFGQEAIGRVRTPVGLPIGSITPEEIAVSIVAQLVEYRRVHGISGVSPSSRCRPISPDGAA